MKPRVSILCPTHNHGALLKLAVRSVLYQTVPEWELFLVGDGIDQATREVVTEVLTWDPRIHFLDHEKSERHGEPYRHALLQQRAQGDRIFYLADDDLWLPQHLELMLPLLEEHDMVHSRSCRIASDGDLITHYLNWELPDAAAWMLGEPRKNSVGLSQVAHRLDFYRQLPHGWRTTPKGEWSDHYMWKQMLSQPNTRATTSMVPTSVQFPSPLRLQMSLEERYQEMEAFFEKVILAPETFVRTLTQQVLYAENQVTWKATEELSKFQTFAHERLVLIRDLQAKEQTLAQTNHALKEEHRLAILEANQRLAALKTELEGSRSTLEQLQTEVTTLTQLNPHTLSEEELESTFQKTSFIWGLKERWGSLVKALHHAKSQQDKLNEKLGQEREKLAHVEDQYRHLKGQYHKIPSWIRKCFHR